VKECNSSQIMCIRIQSSRGKNPSEIDSEFQEVVDMIHWIAVHSHMMWWSCSWSNVSAASFSEFWLEYCGKEKPSQSVFHTKWPLIRKQTETLLQNSCWNIMRMKMKISWRGLLLSV